MSLLVPIYLLAASAAVVLYMASLTMSVFGPARGQWLMVPALLTTSVLFLVLSYQRRKGTLPRAGAAICRYFPGPRVIGGLAIGCFAVAMASLLVGAIVSGGGGVLDGDGPLFASRAEYRLVNHGEFAVVSRMRYITIGMSSLLGWHLLGLLFAFVSLHLVLFGGSPTQPSDD